MKKFFLFVAAAVMAVNVMAELPVVTFEGKAMFTNKGEDGFEFIINDDDVPYGAAVEVKQAFNTGEFTLGEDDQAYYMSTAFDAEDAFVAYYFQEGTKLTVTEVVEGYYSCSIEGDCWADGDETKTSVKHVSYVLTCMPPGTLELKGMKCDTVMTDGVVTKVGFNAKKGGAIEFDLWFTGSAQLGSFTEEDLDKWTEIYYNYMSADVKELSATASEVEGDTVLTGEMKLFDGLDEIILNFSFSTAVPDYVELTLHGDAEIAVEEFLGEYDQTWEAIVYDDDYNSYKLMIAMSVLSGDKDALEGEYSLADASVYNADIQLYDMENDQYIPGTFTTISFAIEYYGAYFLHGEGDATIGGKAYKFELEIAGAVSGGALEGDCQMFGVEETLAGAISYETDEYDFVHAYIAAENKNNYVANIEIVLLYGNEKLGEGPLMIMDEFSPMSMGMSMWPKVQAGLGVTHLELEDVPMGSYVEELDEEGALKNVWFITENEYDAYIEKVDDVLTLFLECKNSVGMWVTLEIALTEQATGCENVEAAVKAVKAIENGQMIIVRDGEKYNVVGAKL